MIFIREYRDNFRNVMLKTLNEVYGDVEIYAFHPSIEDLLISNRGNIKNAFTGKMRKLQTNSNGYLGINVNLIHKGRRFVFAHRLIAETFMNYIGLDNYFYEVNHKDGNKQNNCLTNLEWLTREENLEHSRVNRLTKISYGENSGNCKLTKQDICDIVELRNLGFNIIDISKSYKINRNYCSKITRKLTRIKG